MAMGENALHKRYRACSTLDGMQSAFVSSGTDFRPVAAAVGHRCLLRAHQFHRFYIEIHFHFAFARFCLST